MIDPAMGDIKKNYFYNVLVNVFNTLIPLISFPYISRVLMPDGLGKAQFMINFAQYFGLIAALGIPLYGVREIAKVAREKSKRSKVFLEIFSINLLASIFASLCYLLVVFNYGPFSVDRSYYVLVGVLVFTSFINIDWFYSGLEQFKQIALRSATVKLLSLGALFFFVKTKDDLPIYLLITVFSFLGNQVWNIFMLRGRLDVAISGLNLKGHLRPIFLNFGVLFAISIYTVLDIVLLGLLADEASVGYYSAAVRISKAVIPIVTALGVVLLPRLSRAMNDGSLLEIQYLAEKSFWYIHILAIPAFLGLFIFADELITVVSGPAFSEAVLPMQLLSPLILMIALAHFFAFQLLVPAKKEKWYLIAVIVGAVCCFCLNLLLVPHYRAVGAAFANLVTEAVITFLSFIFVRRFFNIRLAWPKFFVKLIYTGFLFAAVASLCRLLSGQALIVLAMGIPLCVVLYFCVIYFIERDKYLRELLSMQYRRWFSDV